MKEVYKNLFVGNGKDFDDNMEMFRDEGWMVIHAAKSPWHKALLGYTTRGAPKDHKEYLIAERERELYLNLIDAHDKKYIPEEIIEKALAVIKESLAKGQKVFVHCNLGFSRSPAIAFMYLLRSGEINAGGYKETIQDFKDNYYKDYSPGKGVNGYVEYFYAKTVKERNSR